MRKLGLFEINGFELISADLDVPRNKLSAVSLLFDMRKEATRIPTDVIINEGKEGRQLPLNFKNYH